MQIVFMGVCEEWMADKMYLAKTPQIYWDT